MQKYLIQVHLIITFFLLLSRKQLVAKEKRYSCFQQEIKRNQEGKEIYQ